MEAKSMSIREEDSHPMNQNTDKPCFTKRLLDWLRIVKSQEAETIHSQQVQADPSYSDFPMDSTLIPSGKYRAGLTLAELKPGDCGTVRRLNGSTQGRLRILELGLTPGAHLKVIRAAVFGGPLDVLVRGYQLSLRLEEAATVWLDDEDSEDMEK